MQHTRTIKAAAAHYKTVHLSTSLTEYAIRTLVRTGRVPGVSVGKEYRVTLGVLENHLSGNAPTSDPLRNQDWRIQ